MNFGNLTPDHLDLINLFILKFSHYYFDYNLLIFVFFLKKKMKTKHY